jgi:hypothetical protein
LYAWFNFPDFNAADPCNFYLAWLPQQQKIQKFSLKFLPVSALVLKPSGWLF